MSAVHIRNINASDYPAVAALVQNELGYSDLHEERFFERLRYMGSNEDHTTFVAVQA